MAKDELDKTFEDRALELLNSGDMQKLINFVSNVTHILDERHEDILKDIKALERDKKSHVNLLKGLFLYTLDKNTDYEIRGFVFAENEPEALEILGNKYRYNLTGSTEVIRVEPADEVFEIWRK